MSGQSRTPTAEAAPRNRAERRNPDQPAHTVTEAAELARISRSKLYLEMEAGRLRARKVGRRTIILDDDLREWLESLPAA